jgi:hypothetical protein
MRTITSGDHRVGKGNLGKRREQSSQWKGDEIGYRAAHARLYVARGKPEACSGCGVATGRIEWALKHDAEIVKVDRGRSYSPRPADYFPLCCACHGAYDERERDSVTGRWL